jgi:hypothetical protein
VCITAKDAKDTDGAVGLPFFGKVVSMQKGFIGELI